MNTPQDSTAFARLAPWKARGVLAFVLATATLLVAISLLPIEELGWPKDRGKPSDLELYRAVVQRMQNGGSYYQALAAELPSRGYPTRSVFNWRPPLPLWFIGLLPHPILGKLLLTALGAAMIVLAFQAVDRETRPGSLRKFGCALLLVGPFALCAMGDCYLASELWSGVLIALSIGAYGVGRPRLGVICGIAALFCRELAMPYCVVAAGLACWHRRWGDLAGWGIGIACWLLYFGLHWVQATALIAPGARAISWVRFGGAVFVLATLRMNVYLIAVPAWALAVYFVLSVLGMGGWNTDFGRRVAFTTALFVAAFSVAGQDFNIYWGSVTAPLFALGIAQVPAAARDLLRAALPVLKGGVPA